MASIPEFGFGSDVAASGVHVLPLSEDHVIAITPCFVRQSASSPPPGGNTIVGWIASNPAPLPIGPILSHVRPWSRERSKCTRHPCGPSSSLEPASHVPSRKRTGLSLIGPSIPSGSRRGSLHVSPSSPEVFTTPHHSDGDGPTL